MNRAEITRMAREAGMRIAMHEEGDIPALWNCTSTPELEAFAALVAAAERERWAKFCEENQVSRYPRDGGIFIPFDGGFHEGMDFAAAIRANKCAP